MSGYAPLLTGTALRRLPRLPPRTAGPLMAFVCGSLAANPKGRSHELRSDLAGHRSAMRGDFHVLVVLDDETRTMTVVDVSLAPRSTAPANQDHRMWPAPGFIGVGSMESTDSATVCKSR